MVINTAGGALARRFSTSRSRVHLDLSDDLFFLDVDHVDDIETLHLFFIVYWLTLFYCSWANLIREQVAF